jgi:soluble lytic murein transglycosylase
MFKYLIFISIFILSLGANDQFKVTIDWLENKPRGVYKDFYIWRFLNQSDTNSSDALKAIGMSRNINYKILDSYTKYIEHTEFKDTILCRKADGMELFQSGSTDCMATGLTPYKATKIDYDILTSMIDKVNNEYPKYLSGYDVIGASIPFTRLLASPTDIFFDIFTKVGKVFRVKYFNYKIPQKTLNRIVKDKNINRLIELVVPNRIAHF